MIRVLVAEDQAMVRGALVSLLTLESDIAVVAEAGDGREAVELAVATAPDVALVDIEMPVLDGLEAAAAMARQAVGVRVVILTTFGRPGFLRRALQAGVRGFLLKDAPAAALAQAVRDVVAGKVVVQPELAVTALSEGDSPLTPREQEVLRLCRSGRPVAAIAEELHLTEGTVRNYLSEAIGKLGAQTRVEAALIAERKGWL